ncbi:MAG: hypothetical protein KDB80_06205 [Planctomycetes bacterium]|nr:hypothetical protein [Planctomycetota bacterium]
MIPLPLARRAGLVLLASLVAPIAAQNADAPKKFGAVFKRQVDTVINALCAGMREDGSFGDGTALQTAQVLTAMGHCHRFYTLADGPVVRRPMNFLFTRRGAKGGFADAGGDPIVTTSWVHDALRVLEPREYASEIDATANWLSKHGAPAHSPWDKLRLETPHVGGNPLEIGAAAAGALARGPIVNSNGTIDNRATIDALLQLVACQAYARELDRGDAAPIGYSDVAQRGFDFLLTQQEGGVFFVATPGGNVPDTGLSGLGIAALQTKPKGLRTEEEQAIIDAGLEAIVAAQNEDGSFGRSTLNYTTSAAILALSMANDPALEKPIVAGRNFILGIQNIEDRGYSRGDRDYGSTGYSGDQRGDLSNVGFAVEALRRSGLDEQHEAFAKAIVFLQRTQNLRAVNDFGVRRVKDDDGEWIEIAPGDDGGAVYYPGNSAAGYDRTADGKQVPRSYGSMTYMLLKTYTLCGVGKDDVRVQRAVDWIATHWSLDENPGSSPLLPDKAKFQGLYYYYMVLAQALDTAGIDPLMVTDAEGEPRPVAWRNELRRAIAERQRPDGSWLNDQNGRWWESQPGLCTIYALLALHRCNS